MESPVSTASQTGAFNPATPNTTVKHIFLAFILAAWALPGHASCNDRIAVVPRPASVTESKGSFRMTGRTPVVLTDERLRGPAEISPAPSEPLREPHQPSRPEQRKTP